MRSRVSLKVNATESRTTYNWRQIARSDSCERVDGPVQGGKHICDFRINAILNILRHVAGEHSIKQKNKPNSQYPSYSSVFEAKGVHSTYIKQPRRDVYERKDGENDVRESLGTIRYAAKDIIHFLLLHNPLQLKDSGEPEGADEEAAELCLAHAEGRDRKSHGHEDCAEVDDHGAGEEELGLEADAVPAHEILCDEEN